MIKYIAAIFLLIFSLQTHAINTWYRGPVIRVVVDRDDGSFFVQSGNPTIESTCAYKRIYFRVSDMGAERTKAALSMAMTALVTGRDFGIVVDLPAAGERCFAAAGGQGADLM